MMGFPPLFLDACPAHAHPQFRLDLYIVNLIKMFTMFRLILKLSTLVVDVGPTPTPASQFENCNINSLLELLQKCGVHGPTL